MSYTLFIEKYFDAGFHDEDGVEDLSLATKVRLAPHFFDNDGSHDAPAVRVGSDDLPIVEQLLAAPAPAECQADIDTIKRCVAASEGCGALMYLMG